MIIKKVEAIPLVRQLDPDEGAIEIDGQDLRGLRLADG